MAKALTIKVVLSDSTTYYFALESYILQCILKPADLTSYSGITLSGNDYCKVSNGIAKICCLSSSSTSATKILQSIQDVKGKVILLNDTPLLGMPSSTQQTHVDIITSLSLTTSNAGTSYRVSADDMLRFYDLTPKTGLNYDYAIAAIQAYIRFYINAMDDEYYNTIVAAWKTCIKATLAGMDITYTE